MGAASDGRDKRGPEVGHSFHIDVDHMGILAKRIATGEYLDGPEIASVLRDHGSSPIPEVVLTYLCRLLEGTIDKPKGRKPLPERERRRHAMVVRGLYGRYLDYLADRKRRYGHPASWTSLEHTPAELAARIVARLWLSGEESWRTVQNIASSRK